MLLSATITDFFVNHTDALIPAISIIVSTLTAVTAGWLGYLAHNRRLKRQHTVEIMLRLISNRHLAHAALLLDEYSNPDSHIEEFKVTNEKRDFIASDLTEQQFFDLMMLLGYYEYIAVACNDNELSVDVVKKMRKTRIINTWEFLEKFIKERREVLVRPLLYEHFQELAEEFNPIENKEKQ